MTYDIAIVGAGIIGLSHAYAAAKRGLNVLICERTDTPLGASIRNFGFGVVTGQREGEMLSLAKKSRNIWEEWIDLANINAKRNGALLIACNQLEGAVLEAFTKHKAEQYGYDCELLSQKQINALYDGRFSRYSTILHGKDDQVVFSREAIPQIIQYLSSLPNITIKFSTLVKDIDHVNGKLTTSQGHFKAEKIIICSGHDYQTLLADEMEKLNPVVCKLQMLRVRTTEKFDLKHALFTGLSCTHYDAFRDLPETEALRIAIQHDYPEYVKHGIHLLVTPTPHGDLIIGDSHDYGRHHNPFNSEEIDQILIKLAEDTLNTKVNVIERWIGEYGARGTTPYSVIKASNKVISVLMRTGLGMSIGPALAESVIAKLLGDKP